MIAFVRKNILTVLLAAFVLIGFCAAFVGCNPKDTNSSYNIIFLSGEQENASVVAVVKSNGEEEITLPAVPAKQGYELNESRWCYKVAGDDAEYTFTKDTLVSKALTEDLRVYAKYIPTSFKIHYIIDGVDVSEGVVDSRYLNSEPTPQTNAIWYVVSETDLVLPTPTISGKRFVGWYLTQDFDQKVTKLNAGSTGEVVLYAKFVDE